MLDPTYGFEAIGGMEQIKSWATSEIGFNAVALNMQNIDTLRPSGAGQADYFTMLAVQAPPAGGCATDTDLLPPRFAALLDDRATLARQIQDQEPAGRRKVDL